MNNKQNIKRLLPENFGKHIRRNGRLWMKFAVKELKLKGWKVIPIGPIKFYWNNWIRETGKVIEFEKGSPIWIILNIKSPEGVMYDLYYYSNNVNTCQFKTSKGVVKRAKNFDNNTLVIKEWLEKKKKRKEKEREKQVKLIMSKRSKQKSRLNEQEQVKFLQTLISKRRKL